MITALPGGLHSHRAAILFDSQKWWPAFPRFGSNDFPMPVIFFTSTPRTGWLP
jgi:hypothetical protein